MQRYIKAPAPRKLIAITGQEIRQTGEETQLVDLAWFGTRLLLDQRYAEQGFESVLIAAETARALRAPVDGVVELPDAPHWKLLADVARMPTGKAAYDPLLGDINAAFAQAIIAATTDDPRVTLPIAAE